MTTLTDTDRDEREAAEPWAAENRADQRRDDAPFETWPRDPREIAYRMLVEARGERNTAEVDERPSSTMIHAAGRAAAMCAGLHNDGHVAMAQEWAAAYGLLIERSLRVSGVRSDGAA